MTSNREKNKASKSRRPIKQQDLIILRNAIKDNPSLHNRAFTAEELARSLRKTSSWIYERYDEGLIAQECLAMFPNAPIEVRKEWKSRVLNCQSPEGFTILIKNKKEKTEQRFTIDKEKVVKSTARLSHPVAKQFAQVHEERKVHIAVPVTEEEALIEKVRDAYILAPVGEMPNLRALMIEFGIIDKLGRPLMFKSITEQSIRRVSQRDDWRGQRLNHVYATFDVIPDEMRLAAAVRNFELHKMMYQQLKVANVQLMQYNQTGRVKSGDGTTELLKVPTISDIAMAAEVMRRMVDGSGNVNILIQQMQGAQKAGQGETDSMSVTLKRYASKLGSMTPEQLEGELAKMESLRQLVQSDQLTQAETIEAEVRAQEEGTSDDAT